MLGLKFNHPDLGNGIVTGVENEHISIQFKKHTIRFKKDEPKLVSLSKDAIVDLEKEQTRRNRSLENLRYLEMEPLPSTDLEYLKSVKDFVTVRFSWPPFMDDAVHNRFKELGREIPPDARPMNSGSRGGSPMYSLSCEIKVNGKEYLSKVSYGLTLYIQEGFDISYAKKEN